MDAGFKVLVVEDMSNDFDMLQRSLRRTRQFDLMWVQSAGDGLSELDKSSFDVVLLDLTLPDSVGLESVDAFTQLATTPVVVLSGIDDESTALESVQHGAHDYLVKGKFDTPLISRTLRYAIERFRLIEELRESQQQVRRERELRRLECDTTLPPQGSALSATSQEPLKETQAVVFASAVTHYGELIESAMEQRDYKIDNNVTANLRSLADRLGANRASPRDVVDVHTASLSKKLASLSARRSSLCNEEARYLLTGLLGHLCSFYQGNAATSLGNSYQSVPNSGTVSEDG